jgi:hypothetical protein
VEQPPAVIGIFDETIARRRSGGANPGLFPTDTACKIDDTAIFICAAAAFSIFP